MRDKRGDKFMETIIREGTAEFSAQQHDEADSYFNYENAEADSNWEDNADHSNKNPFGSSQPTTSPPKKNKKPRSPTKKENFEERYTITHVGDDGQPLGLVKATTKFVNYYGIIVRENFMLPQGTKEMVKQWALKKMAVLLQTFKTKLWGSYVKYGQAPDFAKYPKLRGDWDLFKKLVEAIDKSSKGEFVHEREKDELTWALENRKYPGRTRGLDNVSWKVGFPEDRGSYRMRRTLREADAKICSLEANHRCLCELHIPMRNLTTGVPLPVLPGQKYHCSDIPPGYSSVSVEQVVSSYEELELEHKGGDGKRTLKEAIHGAILWQKSYIKLMVENRDGGTTTAASTATIRGGSRIESPWHRSPNNDPSPPSPKSPTKPPTHRSPPPCKSSKSSIKPEQLDNEKLLQNQKFVPRWPYEFGKTLVSPDELKALPTQMRQFHDWYMAVSSKGTITFAASVKDDYYCHGDHKIWLSFEDIFEVYQKDAMDVTLMSVWTIMEMQRYRREKNTNLGFIDLEIVLNLKDQCLPDERLTAIQEYLMGFIFKEIVIENGEFHCPPDLAAE
ncbi:hypothetical protein BS78_K165800 [Paspalum vaginatum]|uniref:DUF8039 domain-containing protein n=1 Tax=Paspalum vaginatum TaxID=158149 RepID=A0A9W7XB64_9POAL|nr:hypothetical protein BS78_K165800 [Paspalum vaginatum]